MEYLKSVNGVFANWDFLSCENIISIGACLFKVICLYVGYPSLYIHFCLLTCVLVCRHNIDAYGLADLQLSFSKKGKTIRFFLCRGSCFLVITPTT